MSELKEDRNLSLDDMYLSFFKEDVSLRYSPISYALFGEFLKESIIISYSIIFGNRPSKEEFSCAFTLRNACEKLLAELIEREKGGDSADE